MNGKTEKQIIADGREVRLDCWIIRKRTLLNSELEATMLFRRRLREWADGSGPGEIAPSFHLSNQV